MGSIKKQKLVATEKGIIAAVAADYVKYNSTDQLKAHQNCDNVGISR